MKDSTHPEYQDTTITCACGEVIHTRSTKGNLRIEICSKCRPFFTGQQRLVDTAGRVERFQKKYTNAPVRKAKKTKAAAPAKKKTLTDVG